MTKTKINVGYVYCSATIRSLAGMIWPGSVTVTALDLRLKRLAGSTLSRSAFQVATLGKLSTHIASVTELLRILVPVKRH